jgi:hypothetical protein
MHKNGKKSNQREGPTRFLHKDFDSWKNMDDAYSHKAPKNCDIIDYNKSSVTWLHNFDLVRNHLSRKSSHGFKTLKLKIISLVIFFSLI